MKCTVCGKDNPDNSHFCGGCGVSLAMSSATDIGTVASKQPIVSFPKAIKLGLKNYANFSGRATRAEYWWWTLFILLAGIVLAVVDILTGTMGMFGDSGLLGFLFELAVLIPSLALGSRRLHDINRTGWWMLLWLVPLIGWYILIVWVTQPSHSKDHRTGGGMILWWFVPVIGLIVLIVWNIRRAGDEEDNKYGPVLN